MFLRLGGVEVVGTKKGFGYHQTPAPTVFNSAPKPPKVAKLFPSPLTKVKREGMDFQKPYLKRLNASDGC